MSVSARSSKTPRNKARMVPGSRKSSLKSVGRSKNRNISSSVLQKMKKLTPPFTTDPFAISNGPLPDREDVLAFDADESSAEQALSKFLEGKPISQADKDYLSEKLGQLRSTLYELGAPYYMAFTFTDKLKEKLDGKRGLRV